MPIPSQQQDAYNVFSSIGQNSQDIFNNLQNVSNNYLNNPEQVYSNIMNSYKEKFGTKVDKANAFNQNYNQLAAGGIDPNSSLGWYEREMARKQIEDQAQQNYFNQIMGIQNTGLGVNQNLLSQGIGANNALISGYQTDRQQNLAQQQLQANLDQQKRNNSFWPNLGRTVGGIFGFNLANEILSPVASAIGRGIFGSNNNKEAAQ